MKEPKVPKQDACPKCKNRAADTLIWVGKSGRSVKCCKCGTVYRPNNGVGREQRDDLLAACKALVSMIDDDAGERLDEVLRAARAAIERAEK